MYQSHGPPPEGTLAILAGGLSTRLKTDKGLFRPLEDEPLIARAIRLLGASFKEVLVVVRDREQVDRYTRELASHLRNAGPAIRVVSDNAKGDFRPLGPATGVVTALEQANWERVTILPVDQLGVRAVHLDRLTQIASTMDKPVAFLDRDDAGERPLAFPSVWPVSRANWVSTLVQQGIRSVRRILELMGAEALDPGDWQTDLAVNGNTRDTMQDYFGEPLFDRSGRRLHYLRFSITEACNMACTYCLPDGYPEWYRHKAKLDLASIRTVLHGFRRLGFRKVRFTGGEPTVHRDCLEAVAAARKLGFEDIRLTTNGALLEDLPRWIDAGLTGLNISLDTLEPNLFWRMTKSKHLDRVLALIDQACQSRLQVKINTVLMRSLNGNPKQVQRLIEYALARPLSLRFIELMDTALMGQTATRERVLGSEILPLLKSRGLIKAPIHSGPNLAGPAQDYYSPRFPGRIGLINPLSCNFCDRCNRLRVTARGGLKLCLFGDHDVSLDLTDAHSVAESVRREISIKPERHHLELGKVGNVSTFRTIGG